MIHPRPGAPCWFRNDSSRPLPAGLTSRTPLQIVRPQPHSVIVSDVEGRQWELPLSQVDCGAEYSFADGEWLPESDPQTLSALRGALRDYRAMHHAGVFPRAAGDFLRETCFVLERNGEDVSEFVSGTAIQGGGRQPEQSPEGNYAWCAV
jgi:hypothetical protein